MLETPEEKIQHKKQQKEKTRPAHRSLLATQVEGGETTFDDPDVGAEPVTIPERIKVGAATAKVFSTLFDKSQSRGTINWTAYESAMVDLGFSVEPKGGSVYTFTPPRSMSDKKPLTIHRPHGPRIEGYLIPIYARRLKRVYGWGEDTFEMA